MQIIMMVSAEPAEREMRSEPMSIPNRAAGRGRS